MCRHFFVALIFILTTASFAQAQSEAALKHVTSEFKIDVNNKITDWASLRELVFPREEVVLNGIRSAGLEVQYERLVRASLITVRLTDHPLSLKFLGTDFDPERLRSFRNDEVSGRLGQSAVVAAMPATWGVDDDGSMHAYGYFDAGDLDVQQVSAPRLFSALVCVGATNGALEMQPVHSSVTSGDGTIAPDSVRAWKSTSGCDQVFQAGPRIIHGKEATSNCSSSNSEPDIFERCGIPPWNLLSTRARPVNVLVKWSTSSGEYATLVYFPTKVTLWEVQSLMLPMAGSSGVRDQLSEFSEAMLLDDDDGSGFRIHWAIQTMSNSVAGLYHKDSEGKLFHEGGEMLGHSHFSSVLAVSEIQ